MLSLSREIVRLLLQRQQDGLPDAILAKARLHIADAVGMGLAAYGTPLAQQVLDAASAGVEGGACRVLGSQRRLPPAQAAFANAALMHILDFDDIHDRARLHPTTVTLAAALATATLCKAPGRRVVEAVALGDELTCRLGVMVSPSGDGPGSDWFLTQLFGYLGAALAAGIVRGDDEDAIVAALGLAYMQAGGGKQAGFGTGSTARAIYPAFAAMGGVQAGLVNAAGIAGPELSLDGAAGLFKIYLGGAPTPAQRALLLDANGWHFEQVEIKPWPSCRLSHPYVGAALALRDQVLAAKLEAQAATRIEVLVNASAAKLCSPIGARRRPVTLQDAKYSIPWMVAFTLARGTVDLATLNDGALAAQDILALADRIDILETLPDNPGHPPAEIRLHLGDSVFQSPPQSVFGATAEQARRKFDACLQEARRTAQAPALWRRLLALDAESDIDFVYC